MTRAQLVKDTADIPVGGSEDKQKEMVKQLFKPSFKDKYADLSFPEREQLELEYWLDWIVTNNKRFEGKN